MPVTLDDEHDQAADRVNSSIKPVRMKAGLTSPLGVATQTMATPRTNATTPMVRFTMLSMPQGTAPA